MKKVVSGILVMCFCLLTIITVVNASSINPLWYIGEQFNANGHKVTEEVSRTGNFYNGLELLEKYSEGTMTIQLKGEKKVLFIYASAGSSKDVNISETGALNYRIVDNNYNASGTNDVRLTWKQTTSGHTAANLRY